ncbi:MAG: hypothetical protein K2W96_02705 [Gemmataceae bacterium]|nr:hypothetical protein [Gemmataceae bacterium]
MAAISKDRVVMVPCRLSGASMPFQAIFEIAVPGGVFRGVSQVDYCYRDSGAKLSEGKVERDPFNGFVTGVTVGEKPDGAVRVHLPDGNIYDLPPQNLRGPDFKNP